MTRIVVTGAAGFIGSNIIQGLNARGMDDIIAVDDLTQGEKFRNLADLKILDYLDVETFYESFAQGSFGQIEAVFHQGACSDPSDHNGKFMMNNNYATSVGLYQACQKRGARLLYASSAAAYGNATLCQEDPALERPLSVYGYSKQLFDQRMRRECGVDFRRALSGKTCQVVGLRYFDVYGPREQHKGNGASLAFQYFNQLTATGRILLTEYSGTAIPLHDMVSVDDVVAVNLWFFDHPGQSGIFNVGTGKAESPLEIAKVVINALTNRQAQEAMSPPVSEMINFSPMSEGNRAQSQTCARADLTALRGAGCDQIFTDMKSGVTRYVDWLASQSE